MEVLHVNERLVIIPTYNEKENIRDIITHVLRLQPEFHVLVVDDGSPDGTAALVKEVQRSFDPTCLEGLVTSATDIQACQVTDSKQPEAAGERKVPGSCPGWV